uniref:Uncharacterized protein n=1 Tax=Solanum tuberosum TaxID=4113 RepID=M1BA44_SOLTU
MEASTHDPYELMWRRVPVSYDEIVEASTRDLKGPATLILTLLASFVVDQGSEVLVSPHCARGVTEEHRVLTGSLHTVPTIHELFKKHNCDWMVESLFKYSEEMV